jgi:hypothetical protein
MAYPIEFKKAKAEQFLQALETNQPLAPPEGGWNVLNMLVLAGVLHSVVWSYGPLSYILDPDRHEKLPKEHKEASEETLTGDLEFVIEFFSGLTAMAQSGVYDRHFEPVVRALVHADAKGKRVVNPSSGYKGS